jgi:hypothetical protein
MMVSPKVLAAAIIGKLTNTPEHASECDCDLCKYRTVKQEAQNHVFEQRAKIQTKIGSILPVFQNDDHDELTEAEINWYYNWLNDNYPDVVFKLGYIDIYDRFVFSGKTKIEGTILDIILKHSDIDEYVPKNQLNYILSENEINNGYLESWSAIEEITERKKEGEHAGFEAAYALDSP